MRVLLVDSDVGRAAKLTAEIQDQNLLVGHVTSAADTLDAIAKQACRVVVAEHTIEGGAEALTQAIRAAGHGTPVIVLTDDSTPAIKVALLDSGVDDVIVRPYPPELLPAQIRSLLRRCGPNEGAVLTFEDLSLDLRSLALTRQGKTIPSTSRELAVLEYLLRNPQRVISRQELSQAIWDEAALPGSNVIEVFIARLRRKVDRPFEVPLIHTIVGRGYMMSITKPGSSDTD